MASDPSFKDLEVVLPRDREMTSAEAYSNLQSFLITSTSWYLNKKRNKRRWSKFLRFGAIVLAVSGGLVPIADGVWVDSPHNIGYLLLGVAAGFQLLDRGFGFSAGWSRHLSTAIALQECSMQLAFEYSRLKDVLEADREAEWALISTVSKRVWKIIGMETTSWASDFASVMDEIEKTSAVSHPPS